MFSRVWEQAGGSAVRYEIRTDDRKDFMKDEEFWSKELETPSADLYLFAIPCTNNSIAQTTPPSTRSMLKPCGDEMLPEVKACNDMMRLMCRRILGLLAKGAHVLVENPLLSYLFLQTEMAALIGSPEFVSARADQCMSGTPYQKGQIWTGNVDGLTTFGEVCNHQGRHPEELIGGATTRRSAPYPRALMEKLIGCIVVNFRETGAFGLDCREWAPSALVSLDVRRRKTSKEANTSWPHGDFKEYVDEGRLRITAFRHGSPVAP